MTKPIKHGDESDENMHHNGPAEEEAKGESFRVGDEIDVEDSVGKWCEAQVLEVDGERLLVTYIFWSDSFNEFIASDSTRIQPPGSQTYRQGGELRLGHRIEAQDTTGRWLEAEVIEARPDAVRVHYKNWAAKFDEDMPRETPRIRPYGRHKRLNKASRPVPRGRVTSVRAQVTQDRTRKMAATSTNFGRYEEALRRQSLEITSVEGDGNCMFRAVAHQVYGDDRLHMVVRTKCCDYMLSEQAYFEPFVEGGEEGFMAYLAHKRSSGVWGDDPEIQACCELYDRPAEIYGFDVSLGAKRLRTLHEGNAAHQRPPMRLSYYGGGHYDSLVGPGHRENLLTSAAGVVEDLRIAASRHRPSQHRPFEETKAQSDMRQTEESEMDVALAASREDFDRLDGALDDFLSDQTQLAMAAAEEDMAAREVALAVQAAAEERDLAQALAMSRPEPTSDPTDPELRHALELSMDNSVDHADSELARALAASRQQDSRAAEDEDGALEVALAMSGAMDPVMDEDEEIQRAILLSQEGTWNI